MDGHRRHGDRRHRDRLGGVAGIATGGLIAATLRLLALVALCAAASARAGSLYVATPIGAPNAGSYGATSINASGRMAGWLYGPSFSYIHAWVSDEGGAIRDIGTLGGNESRAYAISRNGKATGYATLAGAAHAFLYEGATMTDLGTLGGSYAVGHAVNDAGQVVGESYLAGDVDLHAFLHSNGVMTNLGSLAAGGGSAAYGINAGGRVVGVSSVAGHQYRHGFVYSNGVMTDIGTLAGPQTEDGYGSAAIAINDAGQVAGSAMALRWGPMHAIVYKDGVMSKLDPPEIYSSMAAAIDSAGNVVGSYNQTSASPRRAFIHTGGRMLDLNDMVLSGLAGWTLTDAVAISDGGSIVANGCLGYQCVTFRLDPLPTVRGDGEIVANPYGAMTVSGATLAGDRITDVKGDVTITLGPVAGTPGSAAHIVFPGISLGFGSALRVRAGAPGQTIVIESKDSQPMTIAGIVETSPLDGLVPALRLRSRSGIDIMPVGIVAAYAGLALDALGDTRFDSAGNIVNDGFVSGGPSLALDGWSVVGAGVYLGDDVRFSTRGHVNNPAYGAYYLQNGVHVAPSYGSDMRLTLNGYGASPQVFNVFARGNVTLSMPSAWPADSPLPPNNAVVPPAGARPAGVPPPTYGGGSMIVQATGSLMLDGGATGDFVFPGGIVLVAGTRIDTNGAVISNGWTTEGTQFQGVFLEAPAITSTRDRIGVLTNDLNWVNFSTFPSASVSAWQLAKDGFGNAVYRNADAWATHLNTYSVLSNAAAAGACWTCLVNPLPVDMR